MKNVRRLFFILTASTAFCMEFHVSPTGFEANDGTADRPYRTISAAANVAQPGDTITVHAGTYRERVTPPRGGTSDSRRITYQAAPGEIAVIKGSEIVRGWQHHAGNVWMVTLPRHFFGAINPYEELIAGDWFTDLGRPHHTGEIYLNGKSLRETNQLEQVLHPEPFPLSRDPEASTWTWCCTTDERGITLQANFHGLNPNEQLVEINVRDSCFYPDQPGRDFITVRGFRMCHAATQWAAPTAEQIGLIGTHWSKGWIIEDNVISDSKCTGITLGKDRASGHNVWSADPAIDGAIHYNQVIERALAGGWSRDRIGSHLVRRNVIFNCEQAGICGSLGAGFSQIIGNHIYNIWTKRQFTGAEMGGIKLHAAIDVLIEGNRIHNAGRGLWLDWMAQGTRVTRNLFYDNTSDDLFAEVNHGPYLVDNNLFLSRIAVQDWSQGGAYVHNLITGKMVHQPELTRVTPFHAAHATTLAGSSAVFGGDTRFYNNVFVGGAAPFTGRPDFENTNPKHITSDGLAAYDSCALPLETGGNVYANGAQRYRQENAPQVLAAPGLRPELSETDGQVFLIWPAPTELASAATALVTTAQLGSTRVSKLPFVQPDGSSLSLDTDYFGQPRNPASPGAGPFANSGATKLKIW